MPSARAHIVSGTKAQTNVLTCLPRCNDMVFGPYDVMQKRCMCPFGAGILHHGARLLAQDPPLPDPGPRQPDRTAHSSPCVFDGHNGIGAAPAIIHLVSGTDLCDL